MQNIKYLLKAELYKHKAVGFIRFYCTIMIIIGIGTSLPLMLDDNKATIDWLIIYNNLLSNPVLINIILSGFAAMYHMKDTNDKSIHHVITSGYTKNQAVVSRILSISIISSFAYLIYILAGIISSIPFLSIDIKSDYGVNIVSYILVTFLLKLLFVIALNVICMTFVYLVRSAAAYFLVVLSLWATALSEFYSLKFIQNNDIYKSILQIFITVQDKLLFMDRIGNGQFHIPLKSVFNYLLVICFTIIVFHRITCLILNKIEIK